MVDGDVWETVQEDEVEADFQNLDNEVDNTSGTAPSTGAISSPGTAPSAATTPSPGVTPSPSATSSPGAASSPVSPTFSLFHHLVLMIVALLAN